MRLNCWMLLTALALPATATEDLVQFESAEQQQLYRQLTAELRCPKCQNQNIADSNAVVAVDMRQKTYQLVQQGQNKQQVLDYMKQRYGDFVHYQPPFQLSTVLLWLLPVMALSSSLPMPVISPPSSISTRFSTLALRVWLTWLRTVSVPSSAASTTVSLL